MATNSTRLLLLTSLLLISSLLLAQNRLGQGSSVNNFSSAILYTGKAIMWGSNVAGKAGLPELMNYILPAAISLPKKVKAISAGYYHSVALMEDGTVYTWGSNNVGQLGNGTTSPLTLNGITVGGLGTYSYSWSTGANTTSLTVSPATTTDYTFTATDSRGCSATDAVTVKVIDVRCGPKMDKVTMCFSSKRSTTCVTQNQVSLYLTKGYTLGSCTTTSTLTGIISPVITQSAPVASPDFINVINKENSVKLLSNPTTGLFKVQLDNIEAGENTKSCCCSLTVKFQSTLY